MPEKTAAELREAFWQADRERGSLIRTPYEEIKRVLAQRDMAWAEKQLAALKQHAIDHTEFYKDYKLEDAFPVMSKTLFIANQEACTAREGFQGPLHVSSTSGSTGTPFSVTQDFPKRNRNIADLQVFGELCDYPPRERMVFFRVLSEKLHRTPEQEARENIYYVDSSDLGPGHLEEMKQVLLDRKPRIVFSYASTLVELAKYIETTGIPAEGFSMKSALTGGEGISEENRLLLERVFGCKVYRRYSNMEMGILGQDSGDGGAYTLNWGSYYFECLKRDCDEPTAPGEPGRIVITDLFNYAFPMIRYDTGDLGVMESPENGDLPRLTEIYGRDRDCIYTVDGRMLSPAKVSIMMWGSENVKQWQFIQEGQKEYTLRLNCTGEIPTEQYIAKLKKSLGEEAVITIEYVDEIPVTSSNKRRAIICNYKKE